MTNDRGHLLVDSAGQAAPGSKFATAERPEFGVALAEGRVDSRRRFSETAGGDLLLVTVPVVDGGEVVGAVRVSSSRESVVDRVHHSWLRLAAIGLAVVAGAFVLAWILATTVSRPLSRLRDTAGELGGGRPRRARPDRRPGRARGAGRFLQPHGRRARLEHARAARLRRERVAPAPHPADRDQASARGDSSRRRGGRRERRESGGGARPSRGARGRPARARRRGDAAALRGSPSTSPRWPKTRSSGGRLPRAKPRRPWRPGASSRRSSLPTRPTSRMSSTT